MNTQKTFQLTELQQSFIQVAIDEFLDEILEVTLGHEVGIHDEDIEEIKELEKLLEEV